VLSAIAEKCENFVVRRLSGVVAATAHICQRFERVNKNTVAIRSYPISDELEPLEGVERVRNQICHVGGMSRIWGLGTLVAALPRIPEARLVLRAA